LSLSILFPSYALCSISKSSASFFSPSLSFPLFCMSDLCPSLFFCLNISTPTCSPGLFADPPILGSAFLGDPLLYKPFGQLCLGFLRASGPVVKDASLFWRLAPFFCFGADFFLQFLCIALFPSLLVSVLGFFRRAIVVLTRFAFFSGKFLLYIPPLPALLSLSVSAFPLLPPLLLSVNSASASALFGWTIVLVSSFFSVVVFFSQVVVLFPR